MARLPGGLTSACLITNSDVVTGAIALVVFTAVFGTVVMVFGMVYRVRFALVIARMTVVGGVVGAAAHHCAHGQPAGSDKPGQQYRGQDHEGDVEPGGVVPGDARLDDRRIALRGD